MRVIIRAKETVTKEPEIDIPDNTENPEEYCLALYNEDELDDELEATDSTCDSFEVEVVEIIASSSHQIK